MNHKSAENQIRNIRRVSILTSVVQAIPGESPPNANDEAFKRFVRSFTKKAKAQSAIGIGK